MHGPSRQHSPAQVPLRAAAAALQVQIMPHSVPWLAGRTAVGTPTLPRCHCGLSGSTQDCAASQRAVCLGLCGRHMDRAQRLTRRSQLATCSARRGQAQNAGIACSVPVDLCTHPPVAHPRRTRISLQGQYSGEAQHTAGARCEPRVCAREGKRGVGGRTCKRTQKWGPMPESWTESCSWLPSPVATGPWPSDRTLTYSSAVRRRSFRRSLQQ